MHAGRAATGSTPNAGESAGSSAGRLTGFPSVPPPALGADQQNQPQRGRSGRRSRPRLPGDRWPEEHVVAVSWIITGCLHRGACGGRGGTGVAGSRGEGPWRRSGEAEPDLWGGSGWFGAVGEGGQRGSYGL